jgi:hypothetical protein
VSTLKGWAWGTTSEGKWLTIPGSYYRAPRLAETPDDATPYPSNIVGDRPVLALVEQHPSWWDSGYAFRIIETAEVTS